MEICAINTENDVTLHEKKRRQKREKKNKDIENCADFQKRFFPFTQKYPKNYLVALFSIIYRVHVSLGQLQPQFLHGLMVPAGNVGNQDLWIQLQQCPGLVFTPRQLSVDCKTFDKQDIINISEYS